TAGAPAARSTNPHRSKSRQPPTCVEKTTRCVAKFTGPPKPMPQPPNANSRRHAPMISAIRAVIQSLPPAASVACDSRRTMASPSNTAIENFVPPISMARIIGYGLLVHAGGFEVAGFYDGKGGGIDVFPEGRRHLLRRERADLLFDLL